MMSDPCLHPLPFSSKTNLPFLLLLNLNSGKTAQDTYLAKIIRELGSWGETFAIRCSQAPGDLTEIVDQALQSKRYGAIYCAGGDGSINEVLQGLLRHSPEERLPIGILPTGTTCDYARTLKIPIQPTQALQALRKGRIHWLDVGQLNENPFCYIASFGAFSNVSYTTSSASKQRIGHLAYVLEGIREIGKLTSSFLRVVIDETLPLEGRFLFGAIANTRSIGGLIRIDSEGIALDDGELELILLPDPRHPLLRPGALAQFLVPGPVDSSEIIFLHGHHFQFSFEEPVPWTLDGEFGGNWDRADIQVSTRAFPLFLPPKDGQAN